MALNFKKYSEELLFLSLGGTCEVGGVNLSAYHYKGKFLLVDLGIGFAEQESPGIEVLLPNIDFLLQHKEDIVGLILTHAHEDHIGGVPYLWEHLKCPIYTAKFTAELLKSKLAEFDIDTETHINILTPKDMTQIGPFGVEIVALTHSVPEPHGIAIHTERGTVFHTGDWKFDANPIISEPTDEAYLKELGDRGILALVSDSTNVFQEEHSGSEGDLAKNLIHLMSENTNGLIAVTTFASNIARLHSIAIAATKNGRKVVLLGRALWRLYTVGRNIGYLEDIQPFLTTAQMKQIPRNELVVVCTGCQGEPLAAVNKMAKGIHPDLYLGRGDSIIFSSKIIPGNEKRIWGLFNNFCRMEVNVIMGDSHFVHVSGHPSLPEVQKMYHLLRPQVAVPIHGDTMHLHEHCKVARSLGVPHVIEIANGSIVTLSNEAPREIDKVDSGYLCVDGNCILNDTDSIFKERKTMRDNGIIIVTLLINKRKELIKNPSILSVGLFDISKDNEPLESMAEAIGEIFSSLRKHSKSKINTAIISFIKKYIRKERGKAPFIQVQLETV